MALNLFKDTPANLSPKVAARIATRSTVELTGLEKWASTVAAQKHLIEKTKELREIINEQLIDHFVVVGTAMHGRPPGFKGQEGETIVDCQLRKRSINSPLSETELLALDHYELPYEEMTDVVDTFIFNPDHKEWLEKNGRAVTQALMSIKGCPLDIVQLQTTNRKHVVTEAALEALFKRPPDVIRQMLPVVGVLGLKPETESPLSQIWETVRGFFSNGAKRK